MQLVRRTDERGRAEHGWLTSRHTFSFANYYDSRFMGFGALRVINEDLVMPARGFGEHPHRNMEILSYLVEGALEHRDSLGNGSTIVPGEVQRMSAGTGVTHSEYNASSDQKVHFLQIWIIPDREGLEPSYEQRMFGEQRRNRLCLVASGKGHEGSVLVHQDVEIHASLVDADKSIEFSPREERMQWLQVIEGRLRVGEVELFAGDALAALPDDGKKATQLHGIEAVESSHFLLFDLPALTAERFHPRKK